MKALLDIHFSDVSDPRSNRNQRHPFLTLVGTTLCAGLSGIDSFSGIADFTESHLDGLSDYFDFPHGCPSHDTYQRFWDAISPDSFLNAFESFTQSLEKLASDIISIDGKTIRNSGKNSAHHVVSAWCESNQLILAQEKVDVKSNEITAIPKLLKLLDLSGCIVTIDAMGAQRKICDQIITQGGDYQISLKGNQGSLLDDIKTFLKDPIVSNSLLVSEENDKGHGRIEQRTAFVTDDIDWLQEHHQWPGLKSIGMVISKVERAGKETQETRFYISSLPADARKFNQIARAHWGIENKLHWRLDVVFNEDKACIRNDNASYNMDIIRKWALNTLQKAKTKPDQSIKSIMRKNSMSFKNLKGTVNKIFHA